MNTPPTPPTDPTDLKTATTSSSEPLLITSDMFAPASAATAARVDFERGMSRWPVLTLALIAANVAVFGWQLSIGALDSEAAIIEAGALARARVLEGEVWRLFSAIFLHAGVEHLVGNCLMLYIVGMACEHGFGAGRAMVIYFVSGLCGSVLSVTMSLGPSVGASGAIFGVVSAVVVFLYLQRHHFFIRDKRIGVVLLVWAAYTVAMGFLTPGIDNFAHIGGLLGGVLVGAALSKP
jgi:rhomboid protease GluP